MTAAETLAGLVNNSDRARLALAEVRGKIDALAALVKSLRATKLTAAQKKHVDAVHGATQELADLLPATAPEE